MVSPSPGDSPLLALVRGEVPFREDLAGPFHVLRGHPHPELAEGALVPGHRGRLVENNALDPRPAEHTDRHLREGEVRIDRNHFHAPDRAQGTVRRKRLLSCGIASSATGDQLHSVSEDQQPIRVGVAGVGHLGQHHARIYRELSEACEYTGFYEVDDARAAEILERYGGRRFLSLPEMAAHCDAVSVAVPTDRHLEVALPLLEAGCHLLVEKPICTTREEGERLLETARRRDCLLQVGHIEQYNPVTSFLEEVVDRPRFITADRLAPFQPRGTEVGVVLDLMIHDIGVILQLVDAPVERIEAVGVDVLSSSEDIANARLVFADGCVANINTSRVSLKKVREIRVFQPQGYLSLDFMNQKGHLLRRGEHGLQKEDIPLNPAEPLRLELESFLSCIRSGHEPKVSGLSGMRALEIALEVTRQVREAAL